MLKTRGKKMMEIVSRVIKVSVPIYPTVHGMEPLLNRGDQPSEQDRHQIN